MTHVPSADFGPVATLPSPREGQLTWAHRLTARAEQDGLQGPEAAVSFSVDSIAPVAAIIDEPAYEASVNDTRPVFRGREHQRVQLEGHVGEAAQGAPRAAAQGPAHWE